MVSQNYIAGAGAGGLVLEVREAHFSKPSTPPRVSSVYFPLSEL